VDEIVAAMARASGLSLQHLLLGLYLIALLLLFAGAIWVGSRLYRSAWTIAGLAAGLTLRHAIAKTGANTLEAYFHPRQMAFALGLLAAGAFLSRRRWVSVVLVLLAAPLHPTTAAWFAVWLGVAAW